MNEINRLCARHNVPNSVAGEDDELVAFLDFVVEDFHFGGDEGSLGAVAYGAGDGEVAVDPVDAASGYGFALVVPARAKRVC